jgi:hypothetical protein
MPFTDDVACADLTVAFEDRTARLTINVAPRRKALFEHLRGTRGAER